MHIPPINVLAIGIALLFVSGLVSSFCLTPLAAVMLRSSEHDMRGRVMGMRMLAIWGLPLGLVAAGPIIARFGFAATTLAYASLGLAATFAIGWDTGSKHPARVAPLPGVSKGRLHLAPGHLGDYASFQPGLPCLRV